MIIVIVALILSCYDLYHLKFGDYKLLKLIIFSYFDGTVKFCVWYLMCKVFPNM